MLFAIRLCISGGQVAKDGHGADQRMQWPAWEPTKCKCPVQTVHSRIAKHPEAGVRNEIDSQSVNPSASRRDLKTREL